MKVRVKKPSNKAGEALRRAIPFPNLLQATPFGFINSNTVGTNDDKITTTMKGVDESDANLEAERGEVIVNPDLSGVYNIGGKPHSRGGTPLYAKGGSFIYSNSKGLAITKQDAEDFDFKKGGNKVKNMTPAKVLKREVDIEEYNRLMSIIADKDQTKIAKTSAALMLEKLQEKMGQVAYLQELKKNFPDGIPPFAAGSAPVENPEIEDAKKINDSFRLGGITSSIYPETQYSGWQRHSKNYGGGGRVKPSAIELLKSMGLDSDYAARKYFYNTRIGADYKGTEAQNLAMADLISQDVPPDSTGKWGGDRYKSKNPKTGVVSNTWNAMTKFGSPEDYAQAVGYTGNPQNIKAMQQWVKDTYPKEVADIHKQYGMPSGGKPVDGRLGVRWDAIADKINQGTPKINMPNMPRPTIPTFTPSNTNPNIPKGKMGPKDPVPAIPWEGIDVPMNAMEKLTVVTPGLEALTAKPYYDMLTQLDLPQVRLDRVDNKQELADIQGQSNLITKEAFANSPAGVAQAISAEVRAKGLQGIAESNSRINQANTQIGNQESMTNYNSATRQQEFNAQQLHNTFNNNQLTQQRMGEFRREGFNQSLNNANAIQTNLDTISQAATASALPYVTNAKDSDGNDILVKGADGRDYTVQGTPFSLNSKRLPSFNPMFGSLDSMGVQQAAASTSTNAGLSGALSKLNQAIQAGDIDLINASSRAIAALYRSGAKGTSTPMENLTQALLNVRR